MRIKHLLFVLLLAVFALSTISCGGEQKRIQGIKQNISLEYNADLDLVRGENRQFTLDVTEIFDLARRPSEGNQIVGVKIADKNIKPEVVGAQQYEYFEEPDGVRLMFGKQDESLVNQAGRFRIRLTRKIDLKPASSGIFRRRFTFEPAKLWALVEDKSKDTGYTPIEMNEPDIGNILLHTEAALGNKQPPGGRRAADRRSLNYIIPADISVLKPLTFTYFPNRTSFYVGTALAWIINRLAWMVLGIVLYVWWVRTKERRKKEKAALRMAKKMEKKHPEPPPKPAPDDKKGPDQQKPDGGGGK